MDQPLEEQEEIEDDNLQYQHETTNYVKIRQTEAEASDWLD